VRTHQAERLRACRALAAALPGLAAAGGPPPLPVPFAWLERQQEARAAAYAERAVALLRRAVDRGFSDDRSLRLDPDFDGIRQHPGFLEVLRRGHPERRYAVVCQASATRASAEVHGLTPEGHLARARQLAAEGYRPVALAVAALAQGEPPVTASVWHRPPVPAGVQDTLARRQAQAAVALVQLGQGGPVWPLLRHTPDPGRRTYLLHALAKLGTDPTAVLRRLRAEPDLSARRALLLALGGYAEAQLPAAERQALVSALLRDYRGHPDPGLHSAAEWLLRRWGHARELRQIEGRLRGQPAGGRGWYVNTQGQTLAVVRGPVEFLMGSPAREPDRFGAETLHRRRIGRSFAIATKAVTVAQFEEFLRDCPEVKHIYPAKVSPDPEGPAIGVTWFAAARYCNWLSAREGIPEEQWCYPRDVRVGMQLPADYLHRKGYRLPTEAEWEYACRAGAVTSRPYGASAALLGEYAWFFDNTRTERTRPVGQLKPNDLGLFDMPGNVWTWCQDRFRAYPESLGGPVHDDREEGPRDVKDTEGRTLRGGGFDDHAWLLRSASRHPERPTNRDRNVGLRVARTYD
jgi:formylglycine-generating enzyme required for sulfatase activity